MADIKSKIQNAKNAKEKWQLKNTEFEGLSFPLNYSADGLDIEILSAKGNNKDLLEIQLNVIKDGVILDVNAPFLFRNPPVIHNKELNITEALKTFVLDTIKTQLK